MIRHHFFISLKETFHAASKSYGGRNIKKIRLGSILIVGKPGTKLTNKPAITNKMGYAIFSFTANKLRNTIAAIIVNKKGRIECIFLYKS